MRPFKDYTTDRVILEMLCKMRVKLAHRRNKDHLIHIHTGDPYYNYHTEKSSKNEELLCSFFPPRKKWKTVLKRKRTKDGIALSSSEKTLMSLYATLRYYRSCEPEAPFLGKLDGFIKEIQNAVHKGVYQIGPPKVIPQLKEDKADPIKVNICRPIASFGLKDKIILSITNRYLTAIFDPLFIDSSYAFRSKRLIKGKMMCPTHHEPVEDVMEYRKQHGEGVLYVAECDMKKFFDTVNHTVIKKVFNQFFKRKLIAGQSAEDLANAKRILFDYLKVYTFNKMVLPLNDNQSHFKNFKVPNGEYGWVKSELLLSGYYKQLGKARIGIPQGGALSGLIANAVLNSVDRKIMKHQDGDLLYVRFCDDMLIIHPNREKCLSAFQAYMDGIEKKKLVIHNPVAAPYKSHTHFWKEKSKSCYKWGSDRASGSPWIGFVGYEVHYQGHIRVRKSSLVKEMKKQYKVVGDLKLILKGPLLRSEENTIYESVASRLIGMSVGRITLWNYKSIKNEMCWVSGYKLLTDNKYSRNQLRRLDCSRNRLLLKLRKKIAKMKAEEQKPDPEEDDAPKPIEQTYYGNPYSYFYQTLKGKTTK